jgi:hypothetical protein
MSRSLTYFGHPQKDTRRIRTTQTAQHYVQDIASRLEAITHEHPFWAEGRQRQALETRALALNPPAHTTVVTIQHNLRFEGK